MAEKIGVLDVIKTAQPKTPEEPAISWVDRKSIKPGMSWEGSVEAYGEKTDTFEWKGETRTVTSAYLILKHEDGTKTGMKFSWSQFRRLLKAANLNAGDKVRLKYLGTVSQQEVLNPELYDVLINSGYNEATRLFEIEILERAPEPEEDKTEELIEELAEE